MSKKILNKIQDLKKQILYHDHLYYNLDQSKISDFEYDLLYKELADLEQQYPELKTEDSPTQRMPGKPLDKFQKESHRQMMLSLQNSYSQKEVEDFYNRMKKLLEIEEPEFFLEPKFDGAAVELIYEKGLLTKALSRGDGKVGENITQNIKTIREIPLKLAGKKEQKIPRLLEVRGEVIIFKKDFEQINKQQAELGEPLFANPRNLASGSLRQLDSSIAARRPLRFYAHSLGAYDEITISTQKDFINLLKSFSLPCFESKNLKQIPNLYKVSRSLKEILKYYSEVEKVRSLLPFEIDGIVIKINSLELQKQVGQIARSPRWAIASKFHPEESITQVKDIVLQVGRTGIVTPVAIMEPVLLSGVTIRQASLHNFKEVGRKDIRLNDFVVIHRAGDVIPEILKSLPHKRKKNSQALKAPTHCPVCKKTLYPDGDYLRCQNIFCDSIRERTLIHFASKKAMNIEFLGEKNIKKFYQWGWLPNFSSFYDLPNKPLAEQEGFGKKSYDLLLKSLENSKQTTLPKLLFSLGIQNIGEQTAQRISETVCKNLLAKNYNLKKIIPLLQKLKEEDLVEITDIGPTVAKSFTDAFQNKNLIKDLINLEKKGCTFIKEIKGTKLQGLQFVITGTFDIGRKELEDLIKQQGGHVLAQISQKTNYLLIGNQPGSKKEKAKKLNIPLLQWEEFKKLSSL